MPEPTPRTRLAAAAGLLGAATAVAFIIGAGPAPSMFQFASSSEDVSGPCDEAEHVDDPACSGSPGLDDGSTTTTNDDGSTTTTAGVTTTTVTAAPGHPAADIRSIDAAGAGNVVVAVEGGSLRLVAATPAAGWRVEVEQPAGREVEVDFRAGSKRVQVNVELEDGQVRERVRVRDDAAGTDLRTENGIVDDADDEADDVDLSGHGHDDSDDSSGPGSGDEVDDADDADDEPDDDDDDDDDDSSGHGSDDD
ncbi:MAG: hypothetical protein ABIX10_08945 [Acidimicrobiales bacterium]